MARGNVRVDIRSTFDGQGVAKAESATARLGASSKKHFGEATKHALGYGAALIGGAGIVGGLESVAEASIAAGKQQAKLETQLKAVGISYKGHAKQIQDVLAKTSDLTGFLDKDLEGALSNIVRSTGNLGQSYKLLGLAADIARTKNIGVADAGQLIGKIYAGNTRVLKSLGLQLDPVTKAQDRLKASTQKATDEQKRAAVAEDKRATAQKAIALLQSKLSGQAQAYGRTTAGSLDKMKAAVDRLEVKLGNALAPTIQKVAGAISKFVTQMQTGTGAGGRFANTMSDLWDSLKKVLKVGLDVAKWLKDHPALLKIAGAAWVAYKTAALTNIALVKAAELGLFGGAMRTKLAGEAATTGGVVGKSFATKAGLAAAAGIAGWEIGTWLRKNVGPVRAAGDFIGNAFGKVFYDKSFEWVRKVLSFHLSDLLPNFGGSPTKNPLPRIPQRGMPPVPRPTAPTGRGQGGPQGTGHVSARTSSVGPMARASKRYYSQGECRALWTAAGGPGGGVADTAAAIAMAESGGDSQVVNSIGATGLWQIHPGGSQYLDPMANARAAVAKYRGAGNRFTPWTTYTGADTGPGGGAGPKTYLNYLGRGGGGGGSTRGGGGGRATPNYGAQTRNATRLAQQRAAAQQKRQQAAARAYAQVQSDYAARKKTFTDPTFANPWLQAYLTHQDYLVATGQLDQATGNANKVTVLRGFSVGKGVSEADRLQALGVISDLTAPPPPADIGTGEDPNQALIDAQNAAADASAAAADAAQALKDSVDALNAELVAERQDRDAIKSTSVGALWGVVADMVNGQIGGYSGYAGRALTAGAGSVYRS